MAFNYARSKATAERLILSFGQSVTLRQVTNSGTEWAPTQAETDATVTVVDLNEATRDRTDALTGRTTRTLLVSTSAGVTPNKGDKFVISGTEHEAGEVRPLNPGGTLIMWEIDLVT